MPKQMQIVDGPGFKQFMFASNVISDGGWTIKFTLQERPELRNVLNLNVNFIGREPVRSTDDQDEYGFMAHWHGQREGSYNWLSFFYVGRYNTRTRKGVCEEFTLEEYRASRIVCLMLGIETKTEKKS